MKITIDIEDDDGTHIYHSEPLSVESAVDKLYSFERHYKTPTEDTGGEEEELVD